MLIGKSDLFYLSATISKNIFTLKWLAAKNWFVSLFSSGMYDYIKEFFFHFTACQGRIYVAHDYSTFA